MTTYLLIRHAAADHVGRRLAGRSAGVRLNGHGVEQARALAASLAETPLSGVYSSPLERARETATPLAEAHGLEVHVSDAFHEVDFGEWTGMDFDALEKRPEWRSWNEFRSTARPPGGEAMQEVVGRALRGLEAIAAVHAGERVAIITHCDVIRPLLAHFAGMPLDHLLRLEIDTASISTVEVNPWGPRILGINVPPGGAQSRASP